MTVDGHLDTTDIDFRKVYGNTNNQEEIAVVEETTIEEEVNPEKERWRNHNWFKPPRSDLHHAVKFYNDDTNNETTDLIFTRMSANTSSFITAPDYKQYIFNTIPNKDMYVMYPNNMVLPIMRHPEMQSRCANYIIQNKVVKQPDWHVLSSGVYIIDYYSLKMMSRNGNYQKEILKYLDYASQHGVVDFDTVTKLKEILSTENTYNPLPGKYLRIITLISGEDICRYNTLFVPHAGVCIGSQDLMDNYIHPSSCQYQHNIKKNISTVKNYIEIDIVDNTTKNDYFIKIGNKVMKLEQERDESKPEKVGISLWKNDKLSQEVYTTLDNINELGIFNSRIQAERDGNAGLEIENKAKELEIEKTKLDTQQLTSNNELKTAQYRTEKVDLELQSDIVKNHFEIDKTKAERELFESKAIYEVESAKLDFYGKAQKMAGDIVGTKLAIMLAETKYELEEAKFDYETEKMNLELAKAREARATSFADAAVKTIKLIGSCL